MLKRLLRDKSSEVLEQKINSYRFLINFKEKYLYHLGTDSQEILINNCKFRDFLEISQGKLSENIDSCIINYLNNLSNRFTSLTTF